MTQYSLEDWSKGHITLKDIEGYTDNELYSVAHIGYFYLMQGKYEDAKVLFEGLVAIDPKNEYYYRALGVIYENLEDFDRAIQQFSYAIRLKPNSAYAYINRAQVYLYLKRQEEAGLDLQKATSLLSPAEALLLKKVNALQKSLTSFD